MNKNDYEYYIVSRDNLWESNVTIREVDFKNSVPNDYYKNWDMIRYYDNYIKTYRYKIGYIINYELDLYNIQDLNLSFWVRFGWLPYWGNLTKKKQNY